MNQTADAEREKRRKYVDGFNNTMIKMWKERIITMNVIDTLNLFHSVKAVATVYDDKVVDVQLSQEFALYGIYQDAGTGREVPKGNPGDIHRERKVRKRKRWFTTKYLASKYNLQEFWADSLGAQMALVMCDIIGDKNYKRKMQSDSRHNGPPR